MTYPSDEEIGDIFRTYGKVPLSDIRKMKTKKIKKMLGRMNIQVDRKRFSRLSKTVISVEEMLEDIMEKDGLEIDDWEIAWHCLRVLWERWLPEKLNFETINDRMQNGYDKLAIGDVIAACDLWLEVWENFIFVIDKNKMKTIDDLDDRFKGLQSFYNWFQDFESRLREAGCYDGKYDRARISACRKFLKRFTLEDPLLLDNTRRGFIESLFAIGEAEKGKALLKEWLVKDPKWGWGWIDWSDYCLNGNLGKKDYKKAEKKVKNPPPKEVALGCP